jgi:hypothetical protein
MANAAYVLLVLTTAAALAITPWTHDLWEPCHLAFYGAAATVLVYGWARVSPSRTTRRWEIGVTAAFLAAMPLIYLARCLFFGPTPRGVWLALELVGMALYVGLAWLGLARSHWFFVLGIAAHGLGWDAWHFHRSAYVPDWYAIGCLVIDVAVSLYLWTRIPSWNRSASPTP